MYNIFNGYIIVREREKIAFSSEMIAIEKSNSCPVQGSVLNGQYIQWKELRKWLSG